MRAGDLIWFCWWKGYTNIITGGPDFIRNAGVIVEEYITLDKAGDTWYDIYIFEDARRLLVEANKIELMKVKENDEV